MHLSCDEQTVRNAIHVFNRKGLEALNENNAQQAFSSSKGCVLLCIESEGLFSLSQQGKFRFYTWLKL